MSFFTQLMQDAAPKATSIVESTKSFANRIVDSKAGKVTSKLAYDTLVNTVGITMVLAKPTYDKVSEKVKSYVAEAVKEEAPATK